MMLCAASLWLGGCGAYQMKGKVIRGDESRIAVVSRDDERLKRPGIGGVTLRVTLDPESLNNQQVGSAESDGKGRFAVPVRATGAGFLQHEVRLSAIKDHYATATRIMSLPSSSKRLLIILAEGQSTDPKRKGRFMDETLDMSEPYMDRPR
jgi:hypothetical protein